MLRISFRQLFRDSLIGREKASTIYVFLVSQPNSSMAPLTNDLVNDRHTGMVQHDDHSNRRNGAHNAQTSEHITLDRRAACIADNICFTCSEINKLSSPSLYSPLFSLDF